MANALSCLSFTPNKPYNVDMSNNYTIIVENSAVERIQHLRDKQGKDSALLRVAINGGGCSGYQYEMEFTDSADEGDIVFADAVVVDGVSLEILNGSTVSFKDDLMGAQFTIDNPNASSGCGCGASFSVDLPA